MMELELVKTIKHFTNENITRGIYEVKINGETKVVVRNGDSFGIVTFWVGKPASECLPITTKKVIDKLKEATQ